MPSIYNYTNYRDYLHDTFIEQKQQQKPLTHRAVLGKMGVTSTGFLSNVISGKKNLCSEHAAALGKILGLAKREQRYFCCMVSYLQAKTVEEKKKNLDKLMAMRNSGMEQIAGPRLDLFSHWYYVYIRDMLVYMDWKDDCETLARMLEPAIKTAEAEQAIRDLSAMGFIARNENGFWKPASNFITTGDETHSVQLAAFQLTTMDMAKRALEKSPSSERDISFVSLTLSSESFARVKEDIQAFRKKLLLQAEAEQRPDRVFQCNIQLFPVTKKQGGGHD